MWLKINDVVVFYSAIESVWYAPDSREVVVRAYSGSEYRQACPSIATGDQCVADIRDRIGLFHKRRGLAPAPPPAPAKPPPSSRGHC